MTTRPRILFVGDDWYGSNATSLRNAWLRLGCEVVTVNTASLSDPVGNLRRRVWKRAARASYDDMASRRIDDAVRRELLTSRFDVLVAFKALCLSASLLESISCPRVHYHPDDSTNPEHRSAIFDQAEPYYDLHITTKSFNVAEIEQRARRPAAFVWCAYDREWHCPVEVQKDHMVGFIGTRRPDREDLLRAVSRAFPGKFLVCGSGWASLRGLEDATVAPGAFGRAFSEAASRAPIQLGLLNSDNRDLHTCRSFEVPAAGALIVAERTSEHEAMFVDRVEALMFDGQAELVDLLQMLERSPETASSIRAAGHRRITEGSNSYDDRAVQILDLVGQV